MPQTTQLAEISTNILSESHSFSTFAGQQALVFRLVI
jgi:hypothetical protein